MVPPFESAPVPSPVAHTMYTPPAVLLYLYDVPEPVQPCGSVGIVFRNGPPTWFELLVCCVSSTAGKAPLWPLAVGQVVAAEVLSGRPPQRAA